MKIAIPVEDKSILSNICISFGRTPYFLIYETDTNDMKFIDNVAATSQGGAGIKAAQAIADERADVVLTPRCGQNAADVLNVAKIKIYKTISISIKDNIKAFEDGKLSLLENIHAGFHGHGGM